MPWVTDGITPVERVVLSTIYGFVDTDIELGRLLVGYHWLADGSVEAGWEALEPLLEFALTDAEFAMRVASTPWVADGLGHLDDCVLLSIVNIWESDRERAEVLLQLPQAWGGLAATRSQYCALVQVALDDFSLAMAVAESVGSLHGGEFTFGLFDSLITLAAEGATTFDQLSEQPWFADGLNDNEAALVTALGHTAREFPNLYKDLLEAHFIQSKIVSLPPAGDVGIWIIQNTPLRQGEELLTGIEDAARLVGELLGASFPDDHIILLLEDPGEESCGARGGYYRSHMRLSWCHGEMRLSYIYHETAHYYFWFGPTWLIEGGAEFAAAYVNDRLGIETLDERAAVVSEEVRSRCSDFWNIRHFTHYFEHTRDIQWGECHYPMGENFLYLAMETIGEEALTAALQELYLLSVEERASGNIGYLTTEELVFDTFMKHADVESEEGLRLLYQRLHGGSFVFPHTEFDDDHGDVPEAATVVTVGEVQNGQLDYMFDFDYFLFQSDAGQKYEINVEHETLPASSVTLLAADEQIWHEVWPAQESASMQPRILWIAPRSGEYLVAVQNFSGETGTYTLRVARVEEVADDHGDDVTEATEVVLGMALAGAVDGEFDRDFFRFEAEDGQEFQIEVKGGTLRTIRLELYKSDGVTPAAMDLDDLIRLDRRGENAIDAVDLKNLRWEGAASFVWIAPDAGTYYLVMDGAHENLGTYTLIVS